MTMLTEHFTEEEFIRSRLADTLEINNEPDIDSKVRLVVTATGLERVRAVLGRPIKIMSGFRCLELNTAVGGSPHSQHMRGEAVDFVCPEFGDPFAVCTFLSQKVRDLGIDQMIMEGTWVHLSFCSSPRNQILTFRRDDGKYLNGLFKV